ncbi:protein INSYN2B isoform X2 [Ambystoma mexicanum]|uniref:protein INSYN2B isoform X2 n=1 Tax=Ambystoma mexicanum TaxID=8296 RepID=UPI0037E7B5C7
MGRKETQCLNTLAHDSMENESKKVQPGLLKRNSLDSIDFLRQQTQRRSKSQQVRFKDDGTKKQTGVNRLEAKPLNDTSVVIGKTLAPRLHNLSTSVISFPRSKSALRNIAIQTSPSLRKHFPIFRKKIIMANKTLKEVSLEHKGCLQANGNIHEQSSNLSETSLLRIVNHYDDVGKASKKISKFKRKIPKAQEKGHVNICSELAKFLTLEKPSVSAEMTNHKILAPKNEDPICSLDTSMDLNSIPSSVHRRESCSKDLCRCNSSHCSRTSLQGDFCEPDKNRTQISLANKHLDKKRTLTSSQRMHNGATLQCFHRDHIQTAQSITLSDNVTLNSDNKTLSNSGSDKHRKSETVPKCQADTDNDFSVSSSKHYPPRNCERGFDISSQLPRNNNHHHSEKEIIEMNRIQLSSGELCAIQGKMKSIEESLSSNQEKIKVLLNVIQDLEKSRALTEGVEYDFRQQEGRFHPVLKTLDQVELSPVSLAVPKTEPEPSIPEKKDIQRKAKKVKKKCFWWL